MWCVMGSFMQSSYHVYVACDFNEDSSSHLVSLMVDENEGLMRLASAREVEVASTDFGATWLSHFRTRSTGIGLVCFHPPCRCQTHFTSSMWSGTHGNGSSLRSVANYEPGMFCPLMWSFDVDGCIIIFLEMVCCDREEHGRIPSSCPTLAATIITLVK